jgi:hypothetical protein
MMKKILIICSFALVGCTKEYLEKPTCFRYLEVTDKWTSEVRPTSAMKADRVDTLWPNGRVANVVCDGEVDRLQKIDLDTIGCNSGGWQSTRYVIFDK